MTLEMRGVHDQIITLLEGLPAGRPVGDGKAPASASLPYLIAYDIAEASRWPSLSGGLGGLTVTIQVSAVAETRASLDVISDQVRAAMLDTSNDLSTAEANVGRVRDLISTSLSDDPELILVRRDHRFALIVSPI